MTETPEKMLHRIGEYIRNSDNERVRIWTECLTIKHKLAEAEKERDDLQLLIIDAHMKAFGQPRNYEYVDVRTTMELLIADISTTQKERDEALALIDAYRKELCAISYEHKLNDPDPSATAFSMCVIAEHALEFGSSAALTALIVRERKLGAAEELERLHAEWKTSFLADRVAELRRDAGQP